MRHLPRDQRGFPIPWFVAVVPQTGERDFRIADSDKRVAAVKKKLCWVCGGELGVHKAFVIGPMCAISRTTSEPPCHLECAHFSAIACPFLTRPRMRRNDDGLEEIGAQSAPGDAIARNPGVALVWVTKSFKRFYANPVDPSSWLITVGEPTDVFWYAQGRTATRAEVEESIRTGLPLLEAAAAKDGAAAIAMLMKQRQDVEQLLPAA
jgi:hypothetical protein